MGIDQPPEPKDAPNTTTSRSEYAFLKKHLAIKRVEDVVYPSMGKGGSERQEQLETPPYERLHQAIEEVGAYQHLNPERQRLLQTYLSTDKTFSDIQREEGFKSPEGVAKNVKKSLEQIFPHLPQEVQQEYKSPKEAVRTKSAHHTESSKRRLRQGLDRLGRADAEKIEFSDTHKQNLSEAHSQRWQRERTARREAQRSSTPLTDRIKKRSPER